MIQTKVICITQIHYIFIRLYIQKIINALLLSSKSEVKFASNSNSRDKSHKRTQFSVIAAEEKKKTSKHPGFIYTGLVCSLWVKKKEEKKLKEV